MAFVAGKVLYPDSCGFSGVGSMDWSDCLSNRVSLVDF